MIGSTRYVASAEIARQSQLAAEMAKLQQSISTGKRLSAPSDDPVAAARISQIRQTQADQTTWTRNVTTGAAIASAADTKLGSVASLLDRAKDLILAGRNEATSTADRLSYVNELRGLADEIGSYASATDANGRALFPDAPVLAIPVSDVVSLTASDSKTAVFGSVSTVAGTKSIADILTGAADALALQNDAQRGTSTTASIAEVDAAVAHISSVRTDQGLRAQRFDDAASRLSSESDASTEERQDLEQTDTTYALATFSAKDTQLKAAQALFAQTHRHSLFDLLG